METNTSKVIDISVAQSSKKVLSNDVFLSTSRVSKILKLISYIVYSAFFGLTVSLSSFILPETGNLKLGELGIYWVFYFLALGLLTISILTWVNGRFSELWIVRYYLLHILNAIILVIAMITFSLFKLSNDDMIIEYTLYYGIFGIFYLALFTIVNLSVGFQARNSFPLIWTKTIVTSLIAIVYSIVAILLALTAKERRDGTGVDKVYLWTSLGIILFTTLFYIVAFIFVQLYRNQLLSDKTANEINSIKGNRDAGIFAILSLCSVAMVLAISSRKKQVFDSTWFIIVLFLALIILSLYFLTVARFGLKRVRQEKNIKEKEIVIKVKKTTPLQNLLLESAAQCALIIAGIVGVFMADPTDTAMPAILITIVVAIILIQIINIALDIQFPLIKNQLITIIKVIGLLAGISFAIVISTAGDTSIIRILPKTIRQIILIFLTILVITEAISLLINFFVASKAIQSSSDLKKSAEKQKEDAQKTIVIQRTQIK